MLAYLDVVGELPLVRLVILLHQVVDVLGDVLPHNPLLVAVRVVPLPVTVVTGESLLGLRDVQATVGGALK